jgi:hypothetical protein
VERDAQNILSDIGHNTKILIEKDLCHIDMSKNSCIDTFLFQYIGGDMKLGCVGT